jgi:3-oxoacyl-[acyl-carrier protein] reductase
VTQTSKSKTALITGASRGIGAATAIALARAGVSRLFLHYNTFQDGAEATLKGVAATGANGSLLHANLGSVDGIHAFVEHMPRDIDLLVNNAGSLVKRVTTTECTEALYDEVMDLNVKSAFFITQAVLPHMLEQKDGVIVNLSSIAARTGGGTGAAVYAAAKGSILTLTKGWARELAPHGIRVNAVSPGTVDNAFHERFSTKQILDSVVAMTPAGRLGTNEEVADTILFLCSEAARYIHGQTIEINGGMLAP